MAGDAKEATPVALTAVQAALRDEIRAELGQIVAAIRAHEGGDLSAKVKALGEKAANLHASLARGGVTVRHHGYMIKNRGLSADEPGFYSHVHPIEDLLKFIDDQNANDDPEDRTIGETFEVKIYSRRWSHDDTYRFTRTPVGWQVGNLTEATTGKDGRVGGREGSGLFSLLDHDSINYPEELPGYLAYLWEAAARRGLSRDEVQTALQALADWINLVEKGSPDSGVLRGYK